MNLIPTKKNTKTITDMRTNALGLLEFVDRNNPLYIFYRNSPRAVMLSMDSYQNLLDLMEGLQDTSDVRELDKVEINEKAL